MKYGIKTLEDVDVKGKKVLVRFDINATITKKDMKIQNPLRLKEIGDTLNALKDAAVIILAHQGRAGDKDFTSLAPHAKVMQELFGNKVKFVPDIIGPAAIDAIKKVKPGEILLLENVRMLAEETLEAPPDQLAKTYLVETLAPLVDIFVNDAYGAAHRGQTSLVGFTEKLPSVMGKIMEKELDAMDKVMTKPAKPRVFLIGGAKVDTKFDVAKALLEGGKADKLLVCGLLQNVFLEAMGKSVKDVNKKPIKNFDKYIPEAKKLLEKFKDVIVLPEDLAINKEGAREEVSVDNLSDKYATADIGEKTIKKFVEIISKAGTIAANGPPGVFETKGFEKGSKAVLEAMAASKAYVVVGGGELGGYADDLKVKLSFISTGGGAMLEYMTGKELPVIAALRKAATPKETKPAAKPETKPAEKVDAKRPAFKPT